MADSWTDDDSQDTGHRPVPYFSNMSDLVSLHGAQPLLETVSHAPCVLYTGRLMLDGEYRELVSGPGSGLFLGADLGSVNPSPIWESAVHPDDWETYTGTHADLLANRPTAIEYRLNGLDGVTRWVLVRTLPRSRDELGVTFDGVVMEITELRSRIDSLAT